MTHHNRGLDYEIAVDAHNVALARGWIVRIGHDIDGWWVEYVGRCA